MERRDAEACGSKARVLGSEAKAWGRGMRVGEEASVGRGAGCAGRRTRSFVGILEQPVALERALVLTAMHWALKKCILFPDAPIESIQDFGCDIVQSPQAI